MGAQWTDDEGGTNTLDLNLSPTATAGIGPDPGWVGAFLYLDDTYSVIFHVSGSWTVNQDVSTVSADGIIMAFGDEVAQTLRNPDGSSAGFTSSTVGIILLIGDGVLQLFWTSQATTIQAPYELEVPQARTLVIGVRLA